jgi:hypothetical protein
MFGCWMRSGTAPVSNTPLFIQFSPVSGAPTFTDPTPTALNFASDASGQGQWQWAKSQVTCLTASGGNTVSVGMHIQINPSQPVDIDATASLWPTAVAIKIPAGTLSAFELANVFQNLDSFVQAPLGVASTRAGQMLIAQGGLGIGNAVSATTPGSVVKKVQIFDNFGNSLGYLPVYSSIS